jgi:hypothetical protein
MDHHIRTTSWSKVCCWIHDCFGRDQHESLIRQLFHIKQNTTVQDYIDLFTELVDQLVAYEHSSDHRYYTTHFIDVLKDDIKHVVLVQRPVDLDVACIFALLQEEAAGGIARRHPSLTRGSSRDIQFLLQLFRCLLHLAGRNL